MPIRAVFIKVNIHSKPLFSGPISVPTELSKLSTAVAEALMPILSSIEPQVTLFASPSVPSCSAFIFGTINNEIPRVPFGASGNLASTIWIMLSVRS